MIIYHFIFSIMNLILTKFRSRLSTKTLDTLMRLRYYPADIDTLDVNRLTFKFLLRHRSCKGNSNGSRRVSEGGEQIRNVEPPLDIGEEPESDDVFMDEETESDDVLMEDAEDSFVDHSYAHDLNRKIIIERRPFEEVFEIVNLWEGNALTAEADGRIMTQEGSIGDRNRRWFKYDQFLVAQNGKVLQDNGPCRWVTLEHADPADPRQKWTIRIADKQYNQKIISGNSNYLDILKDPRSSDVLRIGTNTQRRKGVKSDSGLWKINYLGDFDSHDEFEHLDELEEETDDPMVCEIEE